MCHYELCLPQILDNISADQLVAILATSTVNTTQAEIRFPTKQPEAAVAR